MAKRIILLTVCLIFSLQAVFYTVKMGYQTAFFEEKDKAAAVVRLQKHELEQELEEVEEKLRQEVLGTGSTAIVFEELSSQLYEEAFPILREYGFSGVLALSDRQYPGAEGCITAEQFRELMEQGWAVTLYWDTTLPLARTVEQLMPILEQLDIGLPETIDIAFGKQLYSAEELEEAGFTLLLHHGETEDVIVRRDETKLLKMGAMRWNNRHILETLNAAGEYGGSMAVCVDFSTKDGKFDAERFRKMCGYLSNHQETLEVGDLHETRAHLSQLKDDTYLQQRKAYLEGELQRLDEEVEAIFELEQDDLQP